MNGQVIRDLSRPCSCGCKQKIYRGHGGLRGGGVVVFWDCLRCGKSHNERTKPKDTQRLAP